MKKVLVVIMCVMLLAALVVGCTAEGNDESAEVSTETVAENNSVENSNTANGSAEESSDDGSESKGTIAYSAYTMEFLYIQGLAEGVEAACNQYGYDFILHDQKADETEMVSGATTLLENPDVVGLCISPCVDSALGPIVQKANELGKPIIILDIGIGDTTSYDAFLVSDNYAGGLQMAEYYYDVCEKSDNNTKQVAVIEGPSSAPVSLRRTDAFVDFFEEKGYDVVAQLCGEFSEEVSYSVMKDILTQYPDVMGVYAGSDSMAASAGQAAVDLGFTVGTYDNGFDGVLIAGFDGTDQGYEAIQASYMTATIKQYPHYTGFNGVKYLDTLLNGGSLEFDEPDTKFIYSPTSVVDGENLTQAMEEVWPEGYDNPLE